MSFFEDRPGRGVVGEFGLGRINFSLEPLLGVTPFIALRARASSNLTLTTSFQNVPGATVTLQHPGIWVVNGVFDFNGAAGEGQGQGVLDVDGADESTLARVDLANAIIATVGQMWVHRKTALGPTVLQLQALKTSGAGVSTVRTQTTITALCVPGSETLLT